MLIQKICHPVWKTTGCLVEFTRYFSATSKSGDSPGSEDPLSKGTPPYSGKNVRLPGMHEFKNPWNILKQDFENRDPEQLVPRHSDVIIVGGGIVGCSAAYWLRNCGNLEVTVIERDPAYTRSSSVLNVAGLKQMWSEPESVQMSLFGAEFLRNIKEHLSVLDLDPPDIRFTPQSCLFLSSEKGAEQLHRNYKLQKDLGAQVELMKKDTIKERWPWLNVADVELGTYGLDNEGWFDGWCLLNAMRRKAMSLGVRFVEGELVGFDKISRSGGAYSDGQPAPDHDIIRAALVKTPDSSVNPIEFAIVVNAAGAWASDVAKMAGIGDETSGYGTLSLPMYPRKQDYYIVKCLSGPSIDTPWISDFSGVNIRRYGLGGHFACYLEKPDPVIVNKNAEQTLGLSGAIPADGPLQVDYQLYESRIKPACINRIPAMRTSSLHNAWSAYHCFNAYDGNLIFGNHPYHKNMLFACSGLDCAGHAIAVGRAVMEIILFSEFKSINLNKFGFDRFHEELPVTERTVQ